MTGRYFLLLYCIIGNIMNITEISHKIKTWVQSQIGQTIIILIVIIISNIISFSLGKSLNVPNSIKTSDSNYYSNKNPNNEEDTTDYSLSDPKIYPNGSLSAAVYNASSKAQNGSTSVNIAINGEVGDPSLNTLDLPTSRYVASKNGRVYYFTWCTGGKNIDPEKRVYFNSAQDARVAGYKPSTACAGLD